MVSLLQDNMNVEVDVSADRLEIGFYASNDGRVSGYTGLTGPLKFDHLLDLVAHLHDQPGVYGLRDHTNRLFKVLEIYFLQNRCG
jgi:hypothetical protein